MNVVLDRDMRVGETAKLKSQDGTVMIEIEIKDLHKPDTTEGWVRVQVREAL
jgi:hypothetical protein